MPDSLRVACASNQGELINGHFGSCRYFLIYQVSADEIRLVDIRVTDESDVVDDKNAYRAALIEDAQVVFVFPPIHGGWSTGAFGLVLGAKGQAVEAESEQRKA